MRLWHTSLIKALPREQLVSQWRECSAIAGSIQTKGLLVEGTGPEQTDPVDQVLDRTRTGRNLFGQGMAASDDERIGINGYNARFLVVAGQIAIIRVQAAADDFQKLERGGKHRLLLEREQRFLHGLAVQLAFMVVRHVQ